MTLEPSMQANVDMRIEHDTILTSINTPFIIPSLTLASMSDYEDEKKKEMIYYTVKEGDNFWDIAQKYNISVETILLANNISKNTKLQVGKKLVILPTEGIMHMVEKGDTLSSLAKLYKAEQEEIISYNELEDEEDIYIGDILLIPNGVMPKVVNYNTSPTSYAKVDSDYFISPTIGVITQGLHYYNAIDIANKKGTPIVAVASGTVRKARYAWPSGNYVTIEHPNGVVSYYGHLSYWTVSPGDYVTQGTIIGYMGNTGLVISLGGDGSHLHFDIRGAKNPMSVYRLGAKVSY